mgnify:CR=1 FL=1
MVLNQVITLLVPQQLCCFKVFGRDTNRRLDTAHDLADRVKEFRLRAAASSITHIAEGDIAPARVVGERRDRARRLRRRLLRAERLGEALGEAVELVGDVADGTGDGFQSWAEKDLVTERPST